jgi:hypothetical protein
MTPGERSTSGGPFSANREYGCCNTHIDDIIVSPGIRLASHGIDTISLAWRFPDDDDLWDKLERAEQVGFLSGFDEQAMQFYGHSEVVDGPRGSFMLTDKVCAARWFWYRTHRLIYCEGRLAAMRRPFASIPSTKLASLGDLNATAQWAAFLFYQFLYPHSLPEEVVIRRVDLAADLAFDDPQIGRQFLLSVSSLDVPRLQRDVWYAGPDVASISYRLQSRKIRVRIYDKARESKSGEPGSLIRIERSIRPPKAAQLSPDGLLASDLSSLWLGELKAWAQAGRDVTVGDLTEAQSAVLASVERGKLSPFVAERLLGQLLLRARGYGKDWWLKNGVKAHITARRDADLRAAGVGLSNGAQGGAVCLPLGDILAAVRDAWREEKAPSPPPK